MATNKIQLEKKPLTAHDFLSALAKAPKVDSEPFEKFAEKITFKKIVKVNADNSKEKKRATTAPAKPKKKT